MIFGQDLHINSIKFIFFYPPHFFNYKDICSLLFNFICEARQNQNRLRTFPYKTSANRLPSSFHRGRNKRANEG